MHYKLLTVAELFPATVLIMPHPIKGATCNGFCQLYPSDETDGAG